MPNVFFTSDTHFDHGNIIKYCNRPFANAEEMNETIIERWNHAVRLNDTVYHLGDVAFVKTLGRLQQLVDRLNGHIFLVKGNHDKEKLVKGVRGINYLGNLKRIKVFEQQIVLCHYAMRVWDKWHFGAWHLYGHSHGTLPDMRESLSFDVGVDAWEFTPVHFEVVREVMKSQKCFVSPIDGDRREASVGSR